MSIYEQISAQMKDAMKARDQTRLTALRGIRAAFLTEMKKDNSDTLEDGTCTSLLRRLEKQRKESITAFEDAGREEQAAAEKAELTVIQEFLPSLANEDTTRGWVREAIEASGATGQQDVGRVMGALMKAHRGDVDGGLAQKIASELLASNQE